MALDRGNVEAPAGRRALSERGALGASATATGALRSTIGGHFCELYSENVGWHEYARKYCRSRSVTRYISHRYIHMQQVISTAFLGCGYAFRRCIPPLHQVAVGDPSQIRCSCASVDVAEASSAHRCGCSSNFASAGIPTTIGGQPAEPVSRASHSQLRC
jgi:hypothetical protein